MIELFVTGGVKLMTILTLELVAILLAAFKAPRWVSSLGTITLLTGIISTLAGLFNAFTAISIAGDISPVVVFGASRAALVGIIYA